MNKKGQMTIGILILVVMGIFVGLALFGASAESVDTMTNKQVVVNQENDVSSAYLSATTVNTSLPLTIYTQSEWKQADCPLESVVLRNGADTLLVSATDYVLDADAGTYTLIDTAKTQPTTSLNTTYADYTYCEDGYNKDSSSRAIGDLILIFMALALLAFVLEATGVTDWTGRF